MERPFDESWFYAPLFEVGERADLSEEESRHLRKVLRLAPGRQVFASNGKGKVFLCENRGKGETVELVALEPYVSEATPPPLNMVLSLLKGRDLEEPVEGLCQLAIHAIHIVTTDHTQEFKGQDHSRLVDRLRAKSLVGLKQAKKPWLTEVHPPLSLRKWRESHQDMSIILIHPGADRLPSSPGGSYCMLTGPEGGFSNTELAWLTQEGCFQMGLGETRIRSLHAPLIAFGKILGIGWAPTS